jgi:hypothetical protein
MVSLVEYGSVLIIIFSHWPLLLAHREVIAGEERTLTIAIERSMTLTLRVLGPIRISMLRSLPSDGDCRQH